MTTSSLIKQIDGSYAQQVVVVVDAIPVVGTSYALRPDGSRAQQCILVENPLDLYTSSSYVRLNDGSYAQQVVEYTTSPHPDTSYVGEVSGNAVQQVLTVVGPNPTVVGTSFVEMPDGTYAQQIMYVDAPEPEERDWLVEHVSRDPLVFEVSRDDWVEHLPS